MSIRTYITNVGEDICVHRVACKIHIAHAKSFPIAPHGALFLDPGIFLPPAEVRFECLWVACA
jgi:hypothetical protein